MGKSAGKAPAAPDPYATAAAQTQSNIDTARVTARLNRVNQVTPYGNLEYTMDGPDAWRATTTLAPSEQRQLDLTNQGQEIYGRAAVDQLQRVRDTLSTPVDFNGNSGVEARLTELGRSRLDPMWEQRRAALETQLSNQGIARGSEAWGNAFRGFDQQQNDQYTNLMLTGRQQAVSEMLAQRSVPLNETQALLTGSQVQYPQFTSVPGTTMANTDFLGAQGQSQAAQQAAYNAKVQNAASGNAGAASAASAAAGIAAAAIMASDRRVKDDVSRVGKLNDGTPVYGFRYKSGGPMQIGVMAQDIERKQPGAVVEDPMGIKYVNYGQVIQHAQEAQK